jgi:Bacterial Ig-like domain (group 2)
MIGTTLAWACDSRNEVTQPTSVGPSVTDVTIAGLPPTLTIGQSAQLTALVTLSDGSKKDGTSEVSWQTSDATVAAVSSTGLATMTGAGEALITAALQGVRGTAKLLVSRQVPPATTYEISGVVHESAPTEDVLLSDVLIQVVGGELDGRQVITNANGFFTLPSVTEAGFSLRVKRSGYETLRVPIVSLPHHLNHSIGLPPVAQELHERWSTICCPVPVPSRPLAFVSDRQLAISFPVHHSGKLLLRAWLCVYTCGETEGSATCAQFRDDGGNLLGQRQGIAWGGLSTTFDVTAGHRYDLTVSVCESQPPPNNLIKAYFVGVTRPN